MATTEVKPSTDKNPKNVRNPTLGPKKDLKKKKKTKKSKALVFDKTVEKNENDGDEQPDSHPASASEQLSFFLKQLESAISVRVSALELDPIKDKCIVELSKNLDQNVSNLGEHIKMSFGSSWRETLCEGEPIEGKVDPGNPSVLVVSSSALRSLELLRGLHSLTKQCPAVKLFSKHLRVEEQAHAMLNNIFARQSDPFMPIIVACVKLNYDDKKEEDADGIFAAGAIFILHVSLLKKRVNIGSGTPSRIKKLIDIEALGLSRLDMIVLDMDTDVKGFSLFTLPQVRDEFWDLYKNCFHQRVLEGSLRICLYGPKPPTPKLKNNKKQRQNKH